MTRGSGRRRGCGTRAGMNEDEDNHKDGETSVLFASARHQQSAHFCEQTR
ncbi:hypothetical protein B0H19DRAFT_1223996 [Mycena capillaripes]|nr:hypothetical protein B0H19DRAFT_1223996 [Mycena capillaripes]